MNKLIIRLLPALAAWAACIPAQVRGQGATLSLSVTQMAGFKECPDTVYQNQVIPIQIHVQNVGADTLTNDTITISWMNLDTTVTIYQEDIVSTFVQLLNPNDTLVISTSYQYDSLHYRIGSNIVVVWPRAGNSVGTAADSLQLSVCFDPFLTLIVPSWPEDQGFVIAPNPVTEGLSLLCRQSLVIEHVRIYDSAGRLCLYRLRGEAVSMASFPAGVYLAEFSLRNYGVVRRKILKL